jgi:hypothetical protein
LEQQMMEREQMLKVTIKAADSSALNKILHSLSADASMSLERFDTDALLTEARRRLHKDGYVVNVVLDELTKEPPRDEPEKTDIKRRGRPPRAATPALAPTAAPTNGAPAAVTPQALPPPSRLEVIDALEKYAGQNGMIKAREIIADVSGIKNAALKDVNSADYRKLMEALAC